MPSPDRDVDRLYQLPLSEFTKARDELAKRTDSDRAKIRRLQKPNLPAWAVNQLYWRERKTYEALVRASERLRKAQVSTLQGQAADVARLEDEHERARDAAMDRIQKIVATDGESLSPSVRTAVAETLQALPATGGEPPGYLVRSLKPMGFEALTTLLKGGRIAQRRADVLPFRKTPTEAREEQRAAEAERKRAEERARREAAARQQEIQELETELRARRRAEEQARHELDRARANVERAESRHAKAAEHRRQLEAQLARLRSMDGGETDPRG